MLCFHWSTKSTPGVILGRMRCVAVVLLSVLLLSLSKTGFAHEHSHSGGSFASHGHSHSDNTVRRGLVANANQLWMDTTLAVLGISVAPFVVLLLVPDLNKHQNLLKVLLGFAAGGLLGDAFLHLIPHAISHSSKEEPHHHHGHSHGLGDANTRVFLCVITGIFGFLFIDKVLRFLRGGHEHSHNVPESAKVEKKNGALKDKKAKKKPGMAIAGYLNLAADFTHNFTDGIAIAGSFLISRNVGFVTTLTVLIHELPHEIGDYAILIKSGCGTYKAMLLQLVTALGALMGAGGSLMAAGVGTRSTASSAAAVLSPELITTVLLPITAGGFIYIALVSVLPDLLAGQPSGGGVATGRRLGQVLAELAAVVLGVALMAAIGLFE